MARLQSLDLTMIGAGTTGETFLKAGVHLRWSFRPQLGFPSHGFALFRKTSAQTQPVCFSTILAGRVATANAGWPDVSELVLILDIAPDANVDVWATTLDRYLAAAISRVKSDVGRWDDAVNTPNDNLAGAALRAAELLATRPDNPSIESDPAYQAFMVGQHKRFGLA